MAQQLRILAALAEDLDLDPRIHMVPHNHFYLQFQGILQPFLNSMGTRHMCAAYTYVSDKKIVHKQKKQICTTKPKLFLACVPYKTGIVSGCHHRWQFTSSVFMAALLLVSWE